MTEISARSLVFAQMGDPSGLSWVALCCTSFNEHGDNYGETTRETETIAHDKQSLRVAFLECTQTVRDILMSLVASLFAFKFHNYIGR